MIKSPFVGADSEAWDFVEYFYHTQAWLPKNIVVVNKQAFRRLDEEARRALLNAAARAERRGWEASREETSQNLDVLRDNGMSVRDAVIEASVLRFRPIVMTASTTMATTAGLSP